MSAPRLKRLLAGICAAGLAAGAPDAGGATGCAEDAILVFDGSGSMAEVGHDISANPRIVDARAAVRRAMPDITPFRDVGLLIYGPGAADACSGIDLRFPPAPDAAPAVIAAVEGLEPAGLTPLAASVDRAAAVLEAGGGPGIVVLVTDGNETCGGRPCALGARLAAERPGLRVHVIGFKVVEDYFSWNSPEADSYDGGETVAKCLADATGGMFVSTDTVDELTRALQVTLGCALIGAAPRRRGAG